MNPDDDENMRHTNDDEQTSTVGPNNHVRIGVAVVVGVFAIGLTAQIAQFKATMVNDMSWMKTSLATLVTRFDSLETVKQQVDRLERYGSTSAQDNAKRMDQFDSKIKMIEEFGSPWCRKQNDELKAEIAVLKRELETHELKNGGSK